MSGFQSPNYTQVPNDFFDALPNMSDAEIRATLILMRETFGWHRDAATVGVNEIAKRSGLSYNGVTAGCNAAEKRGTFRRTNPDAKTKAEWEIVVETPSASDGLSKKHPQPVKMQPSASEEQVATNKDKEKGINKAPLPLEWQIAGSQTTIDPTVSKQVASNIETLALFERTLGFGALPWASNPTWSKFERFILRLSQENPNVWYEYAEWRDGKGKFKAMSNRKIRENPQIFMDTGMPEFEASRMYAKPVEKGFAF